MEKLVIFDCDGTLVDSEAIAAQVFTRYWETHGVFITEMEFKENFIGKGNDDPESLKLFQRMPAHAVEEGDRLWNEALRERLQSVKGILGLLTSLKCNMCVGSNSSLSHVKWVLEKTKLDRFFGEKVFSASQVQNPKPAPDLFLHIAKTLGVATDQCIVVEDSSSGVQAAKNAGVKVIAFSGATHFVPSLEQRLRDTEPDGFCSNADELRKLLQEF